MIFMTFALEKKKESLTAAASERENSLNKFSYCYGFVFMNLLSCAKWCAETGKRGKEREKASSRSNLYIWTECKGHRRKLKINHWIIFKMEKRREKSSSHLVHREDDELPDRLVGYTRFSFVLCLLKIPFLNIFFFIVKSS